MPAPAPSSGAALISPRWRKGNRASAAAAAYKQVSEGRLLFGERLADRAAVPLARLRSDAQDVQRGRCCIEISDARWTRTANAAAEERAAFDVRTPDRPRNRAIFGPTGAVRLAQAA